MTNSAKSTRAPFLLEWAFIEYASDFFYYHYYYFPQSVSIYAGLPVSVVGC